MTNELTAGPPCRSETIRAEGSGIGFPGGDKPCSLWQVRSKMAEPTKPGETLGDCRG